MHAGKAYFTSRGAEVSDSRGLGFLCVPSELCGECFLPQRTQRNTIALLLEILGGGLIFQLLEGFHLFRKATRSSGSMERALSNSPWAL